MIGNNILSILIEEHGRGDSKSLIPDKVAGKAIVGLAATEEISCSDISAIETRAEKNGGEYVCE